MVAICDGAMGRTPKGEAAIRAASYERMAHTRRSVGSLWTYASAAEDARPVTVAEAKVIAKEDPELVHLRDMVQADAVAEVVAACNEAEARGY